jgi:hypothetical protein
VIQVVHFVCEKGISLMFLKICQSNEVIIRKVQKVRKWNFCLKLAFAISWTILDEFLK